MKRALRKIGPYLYIVPAVLFVGAFLLAPMLYTLVLSFTEYDLMTPPKFIGLANYRSLLTEPNFLTSLTNTFIWMLGTLLLPVGLGLFIAVVVDRVAFAGVFKSVFYIPLTISAVATGLIWTWMYGPDLGVLNTLLRGIGLSEWARSWLTEVPVNTLAMIAAWTWKMTGQNMIIFLVGLQAIPKEPVEAVKLEGATGWQTFRYVVFPLLRPMTMVVITMSLINSLNQFDLIYVMTQGGPYRSSETLAVTMYRESFTMFHMGYGAAVAIVLSLIVILLSGSYLRSNLKQEGAH
ncbi:MAG: sugar ABC transporter permease [Firmicutes bacterium]|jgi:ABC-type sugar transport system permease subunit|nr:sugar ABC transporter permease [Bacillota bacterium]